VNNDSEQSKNINISREGVLGIILIISAIPASLVLSLYSIFLYARLQLGYWPSYNNPDPKTMGLHYTLWALLTLLMMPIYLLFFGWIMSRKNQKTYSTTTLKFWIIIAVVWWIIFIINCSDPFSAVEWLMD